MQHKVSRAKHTSWCSSMVLTSDRFGEGGQMGN